MAKSDDIHKSKERYLNKREKALKRKVSALERSLYELVFEEVAAKLEVDDLGQIKTSSVNANLNNQLDQVFEAFNTGQNAEVIQAFAKDLFGISDFNDRYFQTFESDTERYERIRANSRRIMNDHLGIDAQGRIKSKGFLRDFIEDTATRNKVKQLTMNSIAGKESFQSFKEQLRTMLNPGDESGGILNAHYRTYAYDTFQEYDRIEAEQYATELGLQAFRYTGGKISTTREFCCQRNNKVWTREEALKWPTKFPGSKGGNVFNTLGGWNCRHSLKWISNDRALRSRPDLKLNDEGKLVYKSGVKRQRLNQC